MKTDGTVAPCCMAQNTTESKLTGTVEQQRNHSYWNSVRADLAAGIQHSACNSCWQSERVQGVSQRTRVNDQHQDLLNTIDIDPTGKLEDQLIRFWDIRDSNICNMGCVSCNPSASSLLNQESLARSQDAQWQKIHRSIGDTAVLRNWSQDAVETQVIDHLGPHTRHLYFAGGEPLINRTHYTILKYLIQHNLSHNITLFYNTNLLKLNHFGEDLWDQWRQFKTVNIGVSIDAVGARAEYARWGTVWSTVDKNCRSLVNSSSAKLVGINTTQSMYTLGGLKNTIRWFNSVGFTGSLRFSHAMGPDWLNKQVLPLEWRQQLVSSCEDEIDMYSFPLVEWKRLRHEILQDTWPDQRRQRAASTAIRVLDKIDSVRNTQWKQCFPELESLLLQTINSGS